MFATLLLVTFHVIGVPDSGLSLAYPHPLRFFADLFSNFRMPAFAFIAGYIYCLRPLQRGAILSFVSGKLRRLALPGLVAMLVFAGLSALFARDFALPFNSLWQVVVFPYAHYWFLQAICTLFLGIGLIDGATRHKATIPLFALATLLVLTGVSGPHFFSLNGALSLAPYFTFGMCAYRYRRWLERHAASVAAFTATVFLASFAISTIRYIADPTIPVDHNILQAMTFGMSLCVFLLLWCPRLENSRKIGVFSFTIYLYHVLGTAGMRLALEKMGIMSIAIHIPFGVASGILVPVLVHLAAKRHPLAALIILGIKPQPTPARQHFPSPDPTALATRR